MLHGVIYCLTCTYLAPEARKQSAENVNHRESNQHRLIGIATDQRQDNFVHCIIFLYYGLTTYDPSFLSKSVLRDPGQELAITLVASKFHHRESGQGYLMSYQIMPGLVVPLELLLRMKTLVFLLYLNPCHNCPRCYSNSSLLLAFINAAMYLNPLLRLMSCSRGGGVFYCSNSSLGMFGCCGGMAE
jgi:hypothetical protein